MGFRAWGLGLGAWGSGFEVLGLGFEVWGLGCRFGWALMLLVRPCIDFRWVALGS